MKNLIAMNHKQQDAIIRELVIKISWDDSQILAINKAFQAGILARDFYLSPHQLSDYASFLERLAKKTLIPDAELYQLLYDIRDQYLERQRGVGLSHWLDSLAVWLYETHTPDTAKGPAVVQMVDIARKWRENIDMDTVTRHVLDWFSIDDSNHAKVKEILTSWSENYHGTPPTELLNILKKVDDA